MAFAALLVSALTWWRNRRTAFVTARQSTQGDGLILENVGSWPAFDVDAEVDKPLARSELWPENYLPVSRLEPGATYGLPVLPADGIHSFRVTVVWRRWRWVPWHRKVVVQLSTTHEGPRRPGARRLLG